MQVLCVASEENEAAIACPVCGQQYEIFYSRQDAAECEVALQTVKKTLEEHHRTSLRSTRAHPGEAFTVPHWDGEPFSSGAALLGGARPRPQQGPVATETVTVQMATHNVA